MRARRSSILAGLLTCGALLAAPASASAAAWLPTTTLSAAGEDATDSEVAVDPAGNATIVFLREDTGSRHVHLQRVRFDGTVEPLLTLTAPGDFASAPAVAVDVSGAATVVWTEGGVIQARRHVPGAELAPVRILSGAVSAQNPEVAVALDGTATVAWTRSDGANQRVDVRSLTPSGDLGTTHTLSAPGFNASLGGAAVDDAGRASVIWQEVPGPSSSTVFVASIPPGAAPGPSAPLSIGDTHAFEPRITTTSDGTVFAAWRGGTGLDVRVKARVSVAGGVFGATQELSQAGAQGTAIAVDRLGAAVVGWDRSDGSHARIQTRRIDATGTLGPLIDVSPPGETAQYASLAIDHGGTTTAVWRQAPGTTDVVHARQIRADGTLGPVAVLSEDGEDATGGRVAVSPAGEAAVVWERGDGTNTRVQTAVYDAVGPTITSLTIPLTTSALQPTGYGVTGVDRSGVTATSWSFGDGALGAGPFVTHTFATPGWRTVTATLTDGVGNTSVATGTTNVAPVPAPPAPRAPTPAKETAKLRIARAQVQRTARRLDLLAPITKLASGPVTVDFRAAGRRTRFTQAIDAARGEVRLLRRIPAAQARLGTGIVTLRYPGDADTRPQEVRLRAASQKANLTAGRPTLVGNRLRASGTISTRARGVVRVQLEYSVGGRVETVQVLARIRAGRWSLDHRFPADRIAEITQQREGTVHSSILFTGYFPARIRGEMRSFQVLGAP